MEGMNQYSTYIHGKVTRKQICLFSKMEDRKVEKVLVPVGAGAGGRI
jgi:hypothetical protein